MDDSKVTAKLIEADLRFIEEGRHLARLLNADEIAELSAAPVPSALDYSKYVTFVRNQNGGGGCGTMSSLAILDILKERERPFSPDFSYKFASYIYNAANFWRKDPDHPGWADPRVPYDPEMNQLKALQQYGCCPEASYPTNYDASSVTPGEPPPPSEWPSDENFAEARQYRIKSFSEPITKPSVKDLKRILIAYGPIFAAGDTPGSPPHGHVFTIVGYDDNAMAGAGALKTVNSYGDRWGNNGFMLMPYSNITNPPPDSDPHAQTYPRVDWIRWVNNLPTPPSAHPITARIKLHHQDKRNRLTISIGVVGQEPVVIWDRPQVRVRPDDSKDLTLDVPLPPYAQEYWPPSDNNRWYVEVEDNSPASSSGLLGEVEEVTLVQRLILPSGNCTTRLFQPSANRLPLPLLRRSTVRIEIDVPTRRTLAWLPILLLEPTEGERSVPSYVSTLLLG